MNKAQQQAALSKILTRKRKEDPAGLLKAQRENTVNEYLAADLAKVGLVASPSTPNKGTTSTSSSSPRAAFPPPAPEKGVEAEQGAKGEATSIPSVPKSSAAVLESPAAAAAAPAEEPVAAAAAATEAPAGEEARKGGKDTEAAEEDVIPYPSGPKDPAPAVEEPAAAAAAAAAAAEAPEAAKAAAEAAAEAPVEAAVAVADAVEAPTSEEAGEGRKEKDVAGPRPSTERTVTAGTAVARKGSRDAIGASANGTPASRNDASAEKAGSEVLSNEERPKSSVAAMAARFGGAAASPRSAPPHSSPSSRASSGAKKWGQGTTVGGSPHPMSTSSPSSSSPSSAPFPSPSKKWGTVVTNSPFATPVPSPKPSPTTPAAVSAPFTVGAARGTASTSKGEDEKVHTVAIGGRKARKPSSKIAELAQRFGS